MSGMVPLDREGNVWGSFDRYTFGADHYGSHMCSPTGALLQQQHQTDSAVAIV
jgi:hypothetical protein